MDYDPAEKLPASARKKTPNGTFAAGNADLCTRILRDEWGFSGAVVSDWGDMDTVADGADAVHAGNDIVMPGGPPVIAQIIAGLEKRTVTREDLLRSVRRLKLMQDFIKIREGRKAPLTVRSNI